MKDCKNLSRILKLSIVVCFILLNRDNIGSAQTIPKCPSKDRGWFVRICEQKTEAPGVRILIGLGGFEASHREWREWRHGEPTEFELPIDLRHAKEIWIKGISLKDDEDVYMGLGFNDHIVKHMDFDDGDDGEEHEKNRDDSDEWDCP